MAWWPVARETDLQGTPAQVCEVAGRSIALFRAGGQWFAVEDQCPHMGASLAAGYLEGCVVACPWHAWRFDIRDGSWCDNPRVKLETFAVKLESGQVWIQLPDDLPAGHSPAAGPDQAVPDEKRTGAEAGE